MAPTSMVGSLSLLPLWIPVFAFVGSLIRKSFATNPFPNHPQSWSFMAPSLAAIIILGSSSLFQQLRPY